MMPCLRTPDCSKKLHCLSTQHGSKHTLLSHHHQFNLALSPHPCSSLQARPSWRIRPIVQAHVYPPPEDATGNEKANGSRRKAAGQAARPVAAVVVLACALGAMCLSSKARACTGLPPDFPPSRPPLLQDEQPTSESQQQKSLEVLCDIFQKKTNCGNYPFLSCMQACENCMLGIREATSWLKLAELNEVSPCKLRIRHATEYPKITITLEFQHYAPPVRSMTPYLPQCILFVCKGTSRPLHLPIMMPSDQISTPRTSNKPMNATAVPAARPSLQSRVLSRMASNAKQAMYQLTRPATAGPLLFTCLCLALAYKNRNKRWGAKEAKAAAIRRVVLQRSLSMGALHGGKVALQRIMDSQEARIDATALDSAARLFRRLLDQDEFLHFKKLQRVAAKLEMSGKEDEAVEMLQKAWEKADKGGQPHEAHELQMLLVEMLIYKGEYDKALECQCLNDKEISDARGPLYKAVIYAIKGIRSRAKECFDEFQEIRARFHSTDVVTEGTPLYGMVNDYVSFEKIVNNLKEEIEHAHKIKLQQ